MDEILEELHVEEEDVREVGGCVVVEVYLEGLG